MERLTNLELWKAYPFKDSDPESCPTAADGRRGSGRSAAHNDDVVVDSTVHTAKDIL